MLAIYSIKVVHEQSGKVEYDSRIRLFRFTRGQP